MIKNINNYLKSIYKISGYIAAIFLILVAIFILTGISSRIFGFYCFTLSSLTAAQPIPGSTLEEFFNAAIEYSPTLQIASENLNISSARKQAANGQLLPQLNAGANVSDNNLEQFNRTQNFTG